MSTTASDGRRAILLGAVRKLVDAARSQRAQLELNDQRRAFYLGVDAAAQEVLHPELAVARADGWLDGEHPEFREGYLRTTDVLAWARTQVEPPLTIPLPTYPTA